METNSMTLEERYANDPWQLELYREKLLEPGWAGDVDDVELDYIKCELRKSASLRRRWGFRPSAKRLSDSHIRAVAMDGVQRKKK
jgi:hypothetical protein